MSPGPGMKAQYSKSYRRQLRRETEEQRLLRLQASRERQRERLQNESLIEREERLAKHRYLSNSRRSQRKKESAEERDRRLEQSRLQRAIRQSQLQQERVRVNYLMQTESAYETSLQKTIRDQLHQRQPKVLRLSASAIKHINIPPPDSDNSRGYLLYQGLIPAPLVSCPMEDEANNQENSLLEPKVIINEQGHLPNPEPMVTNVKTEPMTSDYDEPEMILGDPLESSFPQPMISESIMKSEPMISETNSNPKAQSMDQTNNATQMLKTEINIKSEVSTEEL